MKTIFILILAALFAPHIQDTPSSVTSSVVWKDVRAEYQNYSEIEPTLVNESKQSIYLGSMCLGESQLKRFNEATGKWEAGNWPISCGSLPEKNIPTEIKPGESRKIGVGWRYSVDDKDHPKLFIIGNQISKRSMAGKYKLVIRYGLEPWLDSKPKLTHVVGSEEFNIVR